jgi:protein-L-isoaspartate(D-aspartate) O-methyltransferase
VTGDSSPATNGHGRFAPERRRLVEALAASGIQAPEVLAALGRVPRHRFVPPELEAEAYEDRALPIGEDQTISQPYIVALMTELARIGPRSRVLEVGTGSGYQAAVLAEIAREVYTIEVVEPLAARARTLLAALGYENVRTRVGDGYAGWPEAGPFDAILVTAAAPRIPEPLVAQLAVGGRLVLPVGPEDDYQELRVVTRTETGLEVQRAAEVRFVPMTGTVRGP